MRLSHTISPVAFAFLRSSPSRTTNTARDAVQYSRPVTISNSSKRTLTVLSAVPPPPSPIIGYHLDEEQHWVAQLACGHFQHVRHDPPMVERPWVLTKEGRDSFLGYELKCVKCAKGEPKDSQVLPLMNDFD